MGIINVIRSNYVIVAMNIDFIYRMMLTMFKNTPPVMTRVVKPV